MVKICTDSCSDLSKSQIDEYQISVIPLMVILGEEEYLDGVNIQPKQIFDYVENSGQLPKTAARGTNEYVEFFNSLLKEGDEVVYIGISSDLSSSFQNALSAKREIGSDKLFIVDSRSLSSGIGLLVLFACKLARQGLSGEEIVKALKTQVNKNQTSFVVDRLDYLYKGGRCSAMARFGANLLKIKPRLELIEGKIENTSKYMGQFQKVLIKYVDDMLKNHPKVKKDICFITHTCTDHTIVEGVVDYVRGKNIFDEVVETVAGSTITCHCGENTLGILYLTE